MWEEVCFLRFLLQSCLVVVFRHSHRRVTKTNTNSGAPKWRSHSPLVSVSIYSASTEPGQHKAFRICRLTVRRICFFEYQQLPLWRNWDTSGLMGEAAGLEPRMPNAQPSFPAGSLFDDTCGPTFLLLRPPPGDLGIIRLPSLLRALVHRGASRGSKS